MNLAELCRLVDIVSVTERSLDLIRAEFPPYRLIDRREHLAAVRRQQQNLLDALGNGSVLAGDALTAAADLARTRAGQGIDIDVLIGAFHLGDQVVWEALRAAAPDDGRALAEAAGLMLTSLHALSVTLAVGHAEASQILHGRRITVSQRLVELLSAGTVDSEAAAHARALGLSDTAETLALVWRSPRAEADALDMLRALTAAGVPCVVAHLPAESVLLCQGATAESLCSHVRPCLAERPGGIGLPRPGLAGAAQSIADARLAAGAASRLSPPAVLRLDECWLDAVVLAERERLAPVIAPAAEVARTRPHLAEAVVAFAESGMQVTRAAQALSLHPNSLSYRLERWASLTGWHPRTFEGLRRSMASIQTVDR
jgi:PucR C-terminal helix-turn-helix domain/GGDEF-like domain